MKDDSEGPARHPVKGIVVGVFLGAVLFTYVLIAEPTMVREEGLSRLELAGIYVGGGLVSGWIAGMLWPFQRNRLETAIFVALTSFPLYLLAILALGEAPWIAVLPSIVGGIGYSMIYGAEHSDSS